MGSLWSNITEEIESVSNIQESGMLEPESWLEIAAAALYSYDWLGIASYLYQLSERPASETHIHPSTKAVLRSTELVLDRPIYAAA